MRRVMTNTGTIGFSVFVTEPAVTRVRASYLRDRQPVPIHRAREADP